MEETLGCHNRIAKALFFVENCKYKKNEISELSSREKV